MFVSLISSLVLKPVRRAHHNPHSYDRIENWLPDVEEYTFPTKLIDLTADEAYALLKYRDETKLRAAVRDQERREKGRKEAFAPLDEHAEKSIHDPAFLDEMHQFIMTDWARDPEVISWYLSLKRLKTKLDAGIKAIISGNNSENKSKIDESKNREAGAFIKLSTRSPKDATLNLTRTYHHIRRKLAESKLNLLPNTKPGTEIVAEDLDILNEACTRTLRVTNGNEALRLLLESDRAHADISAHQLYLEGEEKFNLKIAARKWCDEIDSNWEFRLFVVKGMPTALTIYNDFYFDERILKAKEQIEEVILNQWRKVKDKVHRKSKNYCIDFAVTPSLEKVFIIELNNFLAPVAGSGLFEYHNAKDRKVHFLFWLCHF